MKHLLLLFLLAVGASFCAEAESSKVPISEQQALQEIMQLQRKIAIAEKRNDFGAFEKHLLENYSLVLPNGDLLKKNELLDLYKKGDLKFESADFEDLKIKLIENTAVVTGKFMVDGKSGDNKIEGTFRGLGVYQRRGEMWFIAYEHLGPEIDEAKEGK